MSRQIIGAAVAFSLCATGYALGQIHQQTYPATDLASGRTIRPLTPQEKAKMDQEWRLSQAAIAAQDAGDYAEEEADAQASIAIGQDSGLAQELLAYALNAQGKDQEAIQAYKVIADGGGEFPRNMIPYARLLLKSGHYAEAAAAYNKTLPSLPYSNVVQVSGPFSLNMPQPKKLDTALHVAQGLACLEGGFGRRSQREEAMKEFNLALQQQPNSVVTNYYYNLGWEQLPLKSGMRQANAARAKAALNKAKQLSGSRLMPH